MEELIKETNCNLIHTNKCNSHEKKYNQAKITMNVSNSNIYKINVWFTSRYSLCSNVCFHQSQSTKRQKIYLQLSSSIPQEIETDKLFTRKGNTSNFYFLYRFLCTGKDIIEGSLVSSFYNHFSFN